MPITLVTGLPGHGKTLWTLWRLKAEAEKEGRKVYHNDIPGLAIPGWEAFEAKDWQSLPNGSMVVIDEAQTVFPVRGRDRPPEYIEKLATHRHRGFDLVLITQNPMLVDSFVRRLVDRHFHVVRKFGTHWATIHEFTNGVNENVAKTRNGSIRHEWRYSKEVFNWYKSAEVHTVKRRLPARLLLLLAAPFVAAGLIWFAWDKLRPDAQGEKVAAAVEAQGGSMGAPGAPGAPGQGRAGQYGQQLNVAEYLAQHTPRVPDLPHTAPIYDRVTDPVQAPYPAACISSAKRCHCYTQQGTRLTVSDDTCRRFSRDGFFVAWDTNKGRPPPTPVQAAQTQPAALQAAPTVVVVPAPPMPPAQELSPAHAVGRAIRLARPAVDQAGAGAAPQ